MIALFCGSRDWTQRDPIITALEKLEQDSVVVEGGQRGADIISGVEAKKLGFEVMQIEADWDSYGLNAGPIRNEEMLQILLRGRQFGQSVACFAFHGSANLGRGTHDMVVRCLKSKIRTYVYLDPLPELVRVSHLMECKICKRQYINHPLITSALDSNDEPFLNWLCDSRVVKL